MHAAAAQPREGSLEHRDERALRLAPREQALPASFDAAARHRLRQATVDIGVDHRGMDVALAAHRLGVPELLGNTLDRLREAVFPTLMQGLRREHGAGPGAEVLARELLACDLLQVAVDVGRIDRARL